MDMVGQRANSFRSQGPAMGKSRLLSMNQSHTEPVTQSAEYKCIEKNRSPNEVVSQLMLWLNLVLGSGWPAVAFTKLIHFKDALVNGGCSPGRRVFFKTFLLICSGQRRACPQLKASVWEFLAKNNNFNTPWLLPPMVRLTHFIQNRGRLIIRKTRAKMNIPLAASKAFKNHDYKMVLPKSLMLWIISILCAS